MRRFVTFFTALLVAFIGLGFAVLNAGAVEFKYYLGSVTLPLALLLAITLLIGVLLGGLVGIGVALRQRHENSRLSKRMGLLETEIKNLREIPIKDRR